MHAKANTKPTTKPVIVRQQLGAWLLVGLLLASLGLSAPVQAARIKEVAAIEGVRSNQLTGFGLVVGLDGTGDQTTQMPYTSQGIAN